LLQKELSIASLNWRYNHFTDCLVTTSRMTSSIAPQANILVIDDIPENLNLLSAILTDQGYKVRSVTKGSTGLRGAQVAPPDLILLDINMP
jgi:PleD family two-component response regulator